MEAVTRNLLLFLSKGKKAPSIGLLEPYLVEICNCVGAGDTEQVSQLLPQLLTFLVRLLSDETSPPSVSLPHLAKMVCGACAFMVGQTDIGLMTDASFDGIIHVGYTQLRHLQETRSQLHGIPFPLTSNAWNKFNVHDCFLWLAVAILSKPNTQLFMTEHFLPEIIIVEMLHIIEFVMQHGMKMRGVSDILSHFPFVHRDLPRPGQLRPVLQIPFIVLLSHLDEMLRRTKILRESTLVVILRTLTASLLLQITGVFEVSSNMRVCERINESLWENLLQCTPTHIHSALKYRITHLLFLSMIVPRQSVQWASRALSMQLHPDRWDDPQLLERNVAMSLYEVHTMMHAFGGYIASEEKDAQLCVWMQLTHSIHQSQFPLAAELLDKVIASYRTPTLLCYSFITQCYIAISEGSDNTPLGATLRSFSYLDIPLATLSLEEPQQQLLEMMCTLEWARPIFFYAQMCLQYCRTREGGDEEEAFSEFMGTLGICVEERGLSPFVTAYILQFCTSQEKPKFSTVNSTLLW